MTPVRTIETIHNNQNLIHENVRRRIRSINIYVTIQEMALKSDDLSTDKLFQTAFNGFYRFRRNIYQRCIFYSIMERERNNKDNISSFGQLLNEVADRSGWIEVSFVSKMMATLDDRIAPYDKLVCDHLCLKSLPYSRSKKDRIARGIENFNSVQEHLNRILELPQTHDVLMSWNEAFPVFADFRDIKKLDLMLWLMR
ncbi:hypothetical protein JL101_036215 (plasmid) [Skermanella rosea]|uniref:hypothetical protein n=1 Tax=Skermanella rosea TaxID=1817965 RepID=UPI001932AF16|nr:hypothetical protein [Skermanella rosea]UEM08141.1 hypothetical protein JL101_036215 [Skermanella rosea]